MSAVAGIRSTVRRCSCISPPGGNKGSWAAVDVDGLTSVGAVLSLFSDLPAVVFLLDGIFSSGWRNIEKKHITGRGLFGIC